MKTTLNKIREHNPCADGWKELLSYLGKTAPDDDPLPILTVLDSNGLDDALWCLRAVDGHEREIRLYAVECARDVQHLMEDQRSINALDVAERFANGKATAEEMAAAWATTRDAASAAAGGGCAAAWAAAWATTSAAAWAAAWDASAARDASAAAGDARAAAWDTGGDTAWNAIREKQTSRLRDLCK